MRLLVLMYHRARAGRHGNTPSRLDAHFAHIAHHHRCVLPGEPLDPTQLNVCLTFDDGYYDFYVHVRPLLQTHGLRALLAIPPALILESTGHSAAERLEIDADTAFARPERAGFCTWEELRVLASEGIVRFAAHGQTHRRLDNPEVDLSAEITDPKTELIRNLDVPVESFVFPFGRYSPRALQAARARYRHVFRIGGASNREWSRLLYRVDADEMTSPTALFAPSRLLAYRARRWWNRSRGR